MTFPASYSGDVIDDAVPLTAAQSTHATRHRRSKVVAATQASYDGMFSPAIEGISLLERLFVALHTCCICKSARLADHYRSRLLAQGARPEQIAAVDSSELAQIADARLAVMLAFTTKLIERPLDGDRQAVQTLVTAGITTPAIVALGQLISFLSYQVRITAGLQAMAAAEVTP
jgi:uncharacterized protein YciW